MKTTWLHVGHFKPTNIDGYVRNERAEVHFFYPEMLKEEVTHQLLHFTIPVIISIRNDKRLFCKLKTH